jgi:hypothetical protein
VGVYWSPEAGIMGAMEVMETMTNIRPEIIMAIINRSKNSRNS